MRSISYALLGSDAPLVSDALRNGVRSVCLWLALVSAVLGCEPSTSEKRGEFSRVKKAIEDVRLAENAHKAPYLERLEAAPCTHFCALRDQCTLAYRRHVSALSLIEEAKGVSSSAAPEVLARAEVTLKDARTLTENCAAYQGELARKWGR